MGIYSDNLVHEVRLERMRPDEIAAAMARRPAIYVACGSVEWHGYHNAVGLDTLKAHEQLVGLASRLGGVVYPALYLGAGGGHTQWPSSFMVPAEPMIRVLADLLHGFERDGYRKAILLSGHYPNLREYMQPAVTAYRAEGGRLDLLALIENQAPGVAGDHAAKYETSYMLYLWAALVDTARWRSSPQDDITPADQVVNWMGDAWQGHPNYGLVGIDPRPRIDRGRAGEHRAAAGASRGMARCAGLTRHLGQASGRVRCGRQGDARLLSDACSSAVRGWLTPQSAGSAPASARPRSAAPAPRQASARRRRPDYR